MCNILKKQNKILKILSLILIYSIAISEPVKSEKTSKRNGAVKVKKGTRGQAKNLSGIRGKNTLPSVQANQNNAEEKTSDTKEKEEKDTSNITKYNCETLYNKCMNQYCYSPKDGRCSCNESKKFNTSDENCNYIYKACPNLSDDIVATFKRNAKSDCSNFAITDIKNTQTSVSNILAELKICMKPKCKSRQNEFVGCFDNDNFEKKFDACKKVYSKTKDIDLLKSMFKDDIAIYKKKYCDEIYGTIKSDGECYLNIGFGASFKTIQKTKEFKVGDTITCSENSFGVVLGESKQQKLRAIKEIVLTGIDAAQKLTGIASQVVGSFHEVGDEKTKQTVNGIDTYKGSGEMQSSMNFIDITNTAIDGLSGITGSQHFLGAISAGMALKEGNFKYSGYCYVIKDTTVKELFGASDDFYYKLRWDESWTSNMYAVGDDEE